MKNKLHSMIRHVTHGRTQNNRRRQTTRQTRRHYSVPVGNHSDALHALEEIFGINESRLSPDMVIY